ncbi:MAG: NFACT family protein [archaeon]
MPSLELPGISLHAFVEKWNSEWKGGHIQQLRGVGDNLFVLKIHTREGTKELLIALPGLLTETTHKWKAEDDQPGFVNATKKEMDNARIEKITQAGVDRILHIETTQGNLIIELFGDGNLIWTDEKRKIIAVHDAREWKGRTLKRGHEYKLPAGPRAWDDLHEKISEIKTTVPFRNVGGWMVSTLGIPPVATPKMSEMVGRKPDDATELTQTEWKKLRTFLEKRWKDSVVGWLRVEYNKKEWIVPSPEKVKEMRDWKEMFEWIDHAILNRNEEVDVEDPQEKERAALAINLDRQQKQIDAWENDSREKKKAGEWIYENFDLVEQLLSVVKRGKKQKVSDEKMLSEIKRKIPIVQRIHSEKGEIELEIQ